MSLYFCFLLIHYIVCFDTNFPFLHWAVFPVRPFGFGVLLQVEFAVLIVIRYST